MGGMNVTVAITSKKRQSRDCTMVWTTPSYLACRYFARTRTSPIPWCNRIVPALVV
jgi:hypothetical protein